MDSLRNGVGADQLRGVVWRKCRASTAEGNCVEVALLADGGAAVRNSRYPQGPALVYTKAEMEAFLVGVREGDFDFLFG
ncbi:DUF397 domain-containing protein [Streptomyces sp. DSM 44917]|uniref:DUF397 domain-containing protein n=1 Tax=Streptomyces boetiae TaxID=3075541 RepID=A0ABU2L4B1_9ACTN|nr:DUF397 domain-containing protein [Streptomyces sp. DSM 44917]MDT0306392.1 DUF397 domain-containing protein [Streptomyces sp. DSM 44917]